MKETPFDQDVKNVKHQVPERMPEALKVVVSRAKELVEKARLNEAIKIIEALEIEVANMPIAESRFSSTKTMRQGQADQAHPTMLDRYLDMTEAEYRRDILITELKELKDKITFAVTDLERLVWNIEATKQD